MQIVRHAGSLAILLGAMLFGAGVAPANEAAAPLAAYVVLGPEGAPIARVVTEAGRCPTIVIDGRAVDMTTRSAAATAPLRPSISKPELTKPSAFPASTCEAAIPRAARRVSIGDRRLPLPPRVIRRIVVIGDTGCRIKAADNASQACADPDAYPFARVAAAAAAWKPDMVLHVGDYLYRENPCPESDKGCAGSPWGYGLDAWRADFFDPAAPLLKAAPWAMVRGNHESCNRAGQGWRRFFDVYPLTPDRTCDDPANDAAGDFTEPFAVPLGQGAQLVIWDTGSAAAKPFPADDPRAAAYAANLRRIAALAKARPHTILANHHPVLAFAAKLNKSGKPELAPGNLSLQVVLARAYPRLYPAGIDVLLSGHVHVWEQLSFGGRYPSQIVAGFSGTQEDIVPVPETLPPDAQPAPGATPDAFSSWVDGFGFMTLERVGPGGWRAEIHDKTGAVVNRCAIRGRVSRCEVRQVRAG